MKDEKVFYNQFGMATVEKLADIVKSKDLGEISIKNGDCQITVKGKKNVAAPIVSSANTPAVSNVQTAVSIDKPEQAASVSGKQVKAPIVGTFYAAPSPDSKPYVSVGDTVKKGDIIFIIESMKVMSEVQSEYDGVVKEILVNSGEAVEFDQTIMVLE